MGFNQTPKQRLRPLYYATLTLTNSLAKQRHHCFGVWVSTTCQARSECRKKHGLNISCIFKMSTLCQVKKTRIGMPHVVQDICLPSRSNRKHTRILGSGSSVFKLEFHGSKIENGNGECVKATTTRP